MGDPNDWQRWVCRLLRLRYCYDFVEVPDRDRGDCGIEGFSRDGCCYQCYAEQGSGAVDDRYERNRDKMTTDLKKFCENRKPLSALFGQTRIRRWVFVIPVHDSKELVAHAAKKANEIRKLRLPYVTADFEVSIVTEDYFELQRNALANAGLSVVSLPENDVADDDLNAFVLANSKQIDILRGKIARSGAAATNHEALRVWLLQTYLRGEGALEHLKSYPELYETFLKLRANRAHYVHRRSLTATFAKHDTLDQTIEQFEAELLQKLPSLDKKTAELLANAAAVSWLFICSLNFPETAT